MIYDMDAHYWMPNNYWYLLELYQSNIEYGHTKIIPFYFGVLNYNLILYFYTPVAMNILGGNPIYWIVRSISIVTFTRAFRPSHNTSV